MLLNVHDVTSRICLSPCCLLGSEAPKFVDWCEQSLTVQASEPTFLHTNGATSHLSSTTPPAPHALPSISPLLHFVGVFTTGRQRQGRIYRLAFYSNESAALRTIFWREHSTLSRSPQYVHTLFSPVALRTQPSCRGGIGGCALIDGFGW